MVGDHHVCEFLAGQELVVRIDLIILVRAVEISQRGIQTGGLQRGADVFQVYSVRRKRGGIHLHAHRGLLAAADAHQAHARQLGNFLREARVRKVFHLRERNRLGRQRQSQDRRVRGIGLAVNRWRGQIRGQIGLRGVDAGLHFLLGDVNIELERKLQDDDGASVGAGGRHLAEAGNLTKLPLERRRHCGSHYVWIGPGVKRDHLNCGVIHLGQRRDGQLREAHKSGEENREHQERGRDWPDNKWA